MSVGGGGVLYFTRAPGGHWVWMVVTPAGIWADAVIRLDPRTGRAVVVYTDREDETVSPTTYVIRETG